MQKNIAYILTLSPAWNTFPNVESMQIWNKVDNGIGKQLFKIGENCPSGIFWDKQLMWNLPKLATKLCESSHNHMQIGWQDRRERKSKERLHFA